MRYELDTLWEINSESQAKVDGLPEPGRDRDSAVRIPFPERDGLGSIPGGARGPVGRAHSSCGGSGL